jgi:C_GCAxxG_C_C family probable redox protein
MIEEIEAEGGCVEANRAQQLAARGFDSAESVLLAVSQELGIESEFIPRITTGFSYGLSGRGAVCGAVVGGVMAIGLKYGRDEPWQSRDNAQALVEELCQRFQEEMGHLYCRDLTGMDLSTPEGRKAQMSSDVPIRVCLRAIGTAFRLAMELLERPAPTAADD